MACNTRVYPKQVFDQASIALPDMVRFLIDDHDTFTGPGWTIVEAYDSSANAREVPLDPTDLDSLSSAVAWPNGNVSGNSWIVLESADGNNSNHFQLYLKRVGDSDIQFLLIPLQDWATGGGATPTPTLPATAFGTDVNSPVTLTTFEFSAYYSIVADEGMMLILHDDLQNPKWHYFGELNAPRENGTPPDDRCYVVKDDPDTYWDNTTSGGDVKFFNRLSPVDDSTVLAGGTNGGNALYYYDLAVSSMISNHTNGRDFLLGVDHIMPLPVYFGALHLHIAGWLRNVYSVHADLGSAGSLNNRTLIFRNDSLNLDEAGVAFSWDGVTQYP